MRSNKNVEGLNEPFSPSTNSTKISSWEGV